MISWKVQGTGEPLVVLHGLFGSGENWGSYARKWAEGYQVFLPDLPNHGDSGTLEDCSFASVAAVLEAWREREIKKPGRLLGHSLGGKAVMEWALAYPGSVSSLIVADMTPRAYDNHLNRIIRMLLDTDLKSYPDRPSVRKDWEKILGDPVLSAFLVKNVNDDGGRLTWRLRREQLWENREKLWAPLETGRIYPGSALFLSGENSDYIRTGDGILIRELFPEAEIRKVPRAGHWLQVDNPTGFSEALKDYL